MIKLKGTVYMALAALSYLLLNDLEIINMTEQHWNKYVILIATILTGVGILVDPIKPFKDDKSDI